jgi:hypothetical protein
MIASNLNWLFHIDPEWVSDRMLPLAKGASARSIRTAFTCQRNWAPRSSGR